MPNRRVSPGLLHQVKKPLSSGESSQSFTIEPEVADINTDREFLLGIVAFQNGASLDSLGRLETMNAGDSQWVFGITALLQGKYPQAIKALRAALASNDLGELCARNGLSIEVSIPVTPEVTMHIEPVAFGTRLALAEALQGNGDLGDAFDILKSMNKAMPTELIVVISLAEVAFEIDDEHLISMNELVDILSRATPDTDLAWALKFYMARAKARIGAYMEAINSYDNAMQDSLIPDDMRMLAWYEKALTYGNAGEKTRCRQELSSIYAIDRTYADIEERLSGAKHNDKKRDIDS